MGECASPGSTNCQQPVPSKSVIAARTLFSLLVLPGQQGYPAPRAADSGSHSLSSPVDVRRPGWRLSAIRVHWG